jgi:long-chain acyl-CoA synthetase
VSRGHTGEPSSRPALICEERRISFAELEDLQARLAGWLRDQGIAAAERVAILSGNSAELLVVTMGCLRAGVVPVPISPLLTPPERAHLFEDSGAAALFVATGEENTLGGAPVLVLEHLNDELRRSQPATIAPVSLTRPMHYTSGTTGRPKGVWVAPGDAAAAAARSHAFREQWGITGSDVHLVCSPLTHSAPHRFALRTLEAGGCVVVQRRFDAAVTLAAIEEHRVTTTFVVPTHLERILALGEDDLLDRDLTSLRLVAHAGAPIRPETKTRVMELFPDGSVWEFYGSTEGGFTRLSPAEALDHTGSVGRPPSGATLEIRDPEDGRPLQAGETGEVWLRSSDTERFEYWGDEAMTASAWDGDAFTVGDIGYLDEAGYLFLVGRRGDVIISGGINVYPREVEAALAAHPEVAEVLVYGAEDPEWGEQVRALVVPRRGCSPDPEALRDWAKSGLAPHKRPRRITLVERLERTVSGKLKRPAQE